MNKWHILGEGKVKEWPTFRHAFSKLLSCPNPLLTFPLPVRLAGRPACAPPNLASTWACHLNSIESRALLIFVALSERDPEHSLHQLCQQALQGFVTLGRGFVTSTLWWHIESDFLVGINERLLWKWIYFESFWINQCLLLKMCFNCNPVAYENT